jgi:hypothetical protein
VKVKQMLAAGWGGAGSVVDSASIMAASAMSMAQLDRPMLLRSGRSSPVRDLLMSYEHRDDVALPSFLRAPGGDTWASWPEALVSRINGLWARDGSLPAQLDSIADVVPDEILRELRELPSGHGCDEGTAIAVLVHGLAEAGVTPAIDRGAARLARVTARGLRPEILEEILDAIAKLAMPLKRPAG